MLSSFKRHVIENSADKKAMNVWDWIEKKKKKREYYTNLYSLWTVCNTDLKVHFQTYNISKKQTFISSHGTSRLLVNETRNSLVELRCAIKHVLMDSAQHQ